MNDCSFYNDDQYDLADTLENRYLEACLNFKYPEYELQYVKEDTVDEKNKLVLIEKSNLFFQLYVLDKKQNMKKYLYIFNDRNQQEIDFYIRLLQYFPRKDLIYPILDQYYLDMKQTYYVFEIQNPEISEELQDSSQFVQNNSKILESISKKLKTFFCDYLQEFDTNDIEDYFRQKDSQKLNIFQLSHKFSNYVSQLFNDLIYEYSTTDTEIKKPLNFCFSEFEQLQDKKIKTEKDIFEDKAIQFNQSYSNFELQEDDDDDITESEFSIYQDEQLDNKYQEDDMLEQDQLLEEIIPMEEEKQNISLCNSKVDKEENEESKLKKILSNYCKYSYDQLFQYFPRKDLIYPILDQYYLDKKQTYYVFEIQNPEVSEELNYSSQFKKNNSKILMSISKQLQKFFCDYLQEFDTYDIKDCFGNKNLQRLNIFQPYLKIRKNFSYQFKQLIYEYSNAEIKKPLKFCFSEFEQLQDKKIKTDKDIFDDKAIQFNQSYSGFEFQEDDDDYINKTEFPINQDSQEQIDDEYLEDDMFVQDELSEEIIPMEVEKQNISLCNSKVDKDENEESNVLDKKQNMKKCLYIIKYSYQQEIDFYSRLFQYFPRKDLIYPILDQYYLDKKQTYYVFEIQNPDISQKLYECALLPQNYLTILKRISKKLKTFFCDQLIEFDTNDIKDYFSYQFEDQIYEYSNAEIKKPLSFCFSEFEQLQYKKIKTDDNIFEDKTNQFNQFSSNFELQGNDDFYEQDIHSNQDESNESEFPVNQYSQELEQNGDLEGDILKEDSFIEEVILSKEEMLCCKIANIQDIN
ncbi:hypothetical protein ABPG74_019978 [Tetrahymena malaccensis]